MIVSLKKANSNKLLDEFILQETTRGMGPINLAQFAKDVEVVIKAPRPQDQTLGSHVPDGSTGK